MVTKLQKDRVVQTGLRIRVSLRDRLEEEAKRSGISLNSEMERRLEASFPPVMPSDDHLTILEQIVKKQMEAQDFAVKLLAEQRAKERERAGKKRWAKEKEGK